MRIVAFAVLLTAARSVLLYADPLTLSGSGVVTHVIGDEVCISCVTDVLGFSFGVGDVLSFSLTFEPSADLVPDPTVGAYDLGSGTLTLTRTTGNSRHRPYRGLKS
jgi:hypothetical protein